MIYDEVSSGLANVTGSEPFHRVVPAPITTFVGRRDDVLAVHQLLEQSRLVTITGIGGMGKTRLAMQVAAESLERFRNGRFHHGVCFISVNALDTEETLVSAIGRGLGIEIQGPWRPIDQVINYLQDKALLLVLDGLEKMENEDDLLVEILQAAPELHLLITTRMIHRFKKAADYVLQGLSVSPSHPAGTSGEAADEISDAVRLFVVSAERSRIGFVLNDDSRADIARICRDLDGMPMAIEQVASWTRILSVAEIVAENESNSIAPSHSFLDANIDSILDYSWSLLSEAEQKIVCRLAIFPSDFDLAAGRNVAEATLAELASLHAKAMLLPAHRRRYRLYTLVRAYAQRHAYFVENHHDLQRLYIHNYLGLLDLLEDSLGSGDMLEAVEAIRPEIYHIRNAWLTALDLQAYPILIKRIESLIAAEKAPNGYWLLALDNNFVANAELLGLLLDALDSSLPEMAAIDPFLLARMRARYAFLAHDPAKRAEVSHQLSLVRALADERNDKYLTALCHLAEANVAYYQSEFSDALAAAQTALDIGDGVLSNEEHVHALLLTAQSAVEMESGELVDDAIAEIEERIDVPSIPHVRAILSACKGFLAMSRDDLSGAISLLEEAIQLFQEVLAQPYWAARCLHALGFVYSLSSVHGGLSRAKKSILSARQIYASVGARQMFGKTNNSLGLAEMESLNYTAALSYIQEAQQIALETDDRDGLSVTHYTLGGLYVQVGLFDSAIKQFEEGLKIAAKTRPTHSYSKLAQLLITVYDDYLEERQADPAETRLIAGLVESMPANTAARYVWSDLGQFCLRKGDLDAAFQIYSKLFDRHERTRHIKRHGGAAGLAQIALLRCESDKAREYVDMILDDLEDGAVETLINTDRPFCICAICYQVLAATRDSRAEAFLHATLNWLNRVANAIENDEIRHSFLYNIPAHVELLAAGQDAQSAKRGKPVPQDPAPRNSEIAHTPYEESYVESAAGRLTPREYEVLQLVAEGLTNQQIADKLVITKATVRRHLANIYAKMGAGNRVSLVNRAVAQKLIDRYQSE